MTSRSTNVFTGYDFSDLASAIREKNDQAFRAGGRVAPGFHYQLEADVEKCLSHVEKLFAPDSLPDNASFLTYMLPQALCRYTRHPDYDLSFNYSLSVFLSLPPSFRIIHFYPGQAYEARENGPERIYHVYVPFWSHVCIRMFLDANEESNCLSVIPEIKGINFGGKPLEHSRQIFHSLFPNRTCTGGAGTRGLCSAELEGTGLEAGKDLVEGSYIDTQTTWSSAALESDFFFGAGVNFDNGVSFSYFLRKILSLSDEDTEQIQRTIMPTGQIRGYRRETARQAFHTAFSTWEQTDVETLQKLTLPRGGTFPKNMLGRMYNLPEYLDVKPINIPLFSHPDNAKVLESMSEDGNIII